MNIKRFIQKFYDLGNPRRCLQGCGQFVPKDKLFCSPECLARYNPETWGEGRGSQTLVPVLKKSLKATR
jgi:hypothetical protein